MVHILVIELGFFALVNIIKLCTNHDVILNKLIIRKEYYLQIRYQINAHRSSDEYVYMLVKNNLNTMPMRVYI